MQQRSGDLNLDSRRHMVDTQIRARGITDERVLQAMEQVPRERFIGPDQRASAFADRALTIAHGQTISQPFMVAAMTAKLQVQPHHRVLEIGTGSGYQTAILARLARQVYTIERIEPLCAASQQMLASLGITNVTFRTGDGSLGWPEQAPFECIIATAGAPGIPNALVEQLTDGGRLVIPVGSQYEQILTVVERWAGRTREIPSIPCRFVKLIGREAWTDHNVSQTP